MDALSAVEIFYDAIAKGEKNLLESILIRYHSDEHMSIINARGRKDAMSNNPLQYAILMGQVEIAKYLVQSGADFCQLNNAGNSALHYAIQEGQMAVVSLLLSRGADINSKTNGGDGFSPLQIAILRGFVELAAYLIDQGINIHLQSSKGHTALHHAIQEGHIDIVERLTAGGADINLVKPDDNLSPLQWAIWRSHREISIHLIERGADVQFKNRDGHTALHVAIYRGLKDLVVLLLNKQADLLVKKRDGTTLLHWAILHGQLEIIEILVSRVGSDPKLIADIINTVNAKGFNALHYAIRESLDEVVTFLLLKGADVNVKKGDDGCSPLQFAVVKSDNEITKILLDNGADINTMSNSGLVALHQAIQINNFKCVELLIERGAQVNTIKQDDGNSPLQWAILHGHQDIAYYLLSFGSDIHHVNDNGVTSLHLAIEVGLIDVVRELVRQGADVNVKKLDDGLLPWTWAILKGEAEIAEYLAVMGASVQKDIELYVSSLAERGIGILTNPSNNDIDDLDSESSSIISAIVDTALHCAVRDSQLDLLIHLVSRGDDVNLKAADGMTPLHVAISRRDFPMSEYLLDHGADVHAPDIEARTSLQLAVESGQLNFIKLLLRYGADINVPLSNPKGYTPLQVAIADGNQDMVEFLVDQCEADILQSNEDGFTPLHIAAECSNLELVSVLLDKGADRDTKSWGGYSPLHWTIVQQGHYRIVELLIHRGANIFTDNNDGETALDSAISNKQYEIALMLLGKGAIASMTSDFTIRQITNFPCIYCNEEVPLIEYFKDVFLNLPVTKVKPIRAHLLSKSKSSYRILRTLIGALTHDEAQLNVRLHICGDNLSGKSTLKEAILRSCNKKSLNWSPRQSTSSNDRIQNMGSTNGIELSKCSYLGSKFIIYDYSGDEMYYPFYDYFLSQPSSIFVIVVALLTVRVSSSKEKQFSIISNQAILESYRTWLQLLNSVIPATVHEIACLTMINFKTMADDMEPGKSSRVQKLIADEQLHWIKKKLSIPPAKANDQPKLRRMVFVQDKYPMAFDISNKKEVMNQVNAKVQQALTTSIESLQSIATTKLVQAILETREAGHEPRSTFSLNRGYSMSFNNRTNNNLLVSWQQLSTTSEFECNIIQPEIIKLFNGLKLSSNDLSTAAVMDNIKSYLVKVAWKSLISAGEIFVIGDLVVTDVNWFTNDVLKSLVKSIARSNNRLITDEIIAEMSPSITSGLHLSTLFQSMGFCLSVDKDSTCNIQDKVNWFPIISKETAGHILSFKMVGQIMREFILSMSNSTIEASAVLRRFALVDNTRQTFPLGYLGLFLSALLNVEDGRYSTMEKFDNGVVLIGTSAEIDFLITVMFVTGSHETPAFFVVGVMCRSMTFIQETEVDPTNGIQVGSRTASMSMWYRLEKICQLVNISNSYRFISAADHDEATGQSSFNQALHLKVFCIDPRNFEEVSEVSLPDAIAANDNDNLESSFDNMERDNLYAKYFGVDGNLIPLQDVESFYRKRLFNRVLISEMAEDSNDKEGNEESNKVFKNATNEMIDAVPPVDEEQDDLSIDEEPQMMRAERGDVIVDELSPSRNRDVVLVPDVGVRKSVEKNVVKNLTKNLEKNLKKNIEKNIDGIIEKNPDRNLELNIHEKSNEKSLDTDIVVRDDIKIEDADEVSQLDSSENCSNEGARIIDARLLDRQLLQEMASFLETKSAALIPMTFVIKPTLPHEMLRSGPNPWRKIAHAWKRNVKYRFSGLLWQECRLVFICPITLKEVPCGGNKIDSSNGYRVSIPVEFLKPLAAALTFGILYLKSALESTDPLEILVDRNSGSSFMIADNYLRPDVFRNCHYFKHILEDVGHMDLLGHILDGAEYKSQQAFIDLVTTTQTQMSVMDGLFKWSTIYNLLAQSELGNQIDEIPVDWKPKLTGLHCVCLKDQDGNTARKLWVSEEALPQLIETGWVLQH